MTSDWSNAFVIQWLPVVLSFLNILFCLKTFATVWQWDMLVQSFNSYFFCVSYQGALRSHPNIFQSAFFAVVTDIERIVLFHPYNEVFN